MGMLYLKLAMLAGSPRDDGTGHPSNCTGDIEQAITRPFEGEQAPQYPSTQGKRSVVTVRIRTFQVAPIRITIVGESAHPRRRAGLVFFRRSRGGKLKLRMGLQLEPVIENVTRHTRRSLRERDGCRGKQCPCRRNGTNTSSKQKFHDDFTQVARPESLKKNNS